MRTYILALALAGTAIGGAAYAGQRGDGGMRPDTNGDGVVSRAEMMAQAERRFARLDANGDGVLTADEVKRGMDMMDTNKDGKVTKAEYLARAADRFAKLDTNNDGNVSPDERKAMMTNMRAAGGGMSMRAPGGPDGPGGMRGDPGHHGRGDTLMKIDTDKDGRISLAEMRARTDARFAKLDTNKDGFVDAAEMQAAHAQMKEKMGKMRAHWRNRAGGPGTPPPPGAPAPAPDAGQ